MDWLSKQIRKWGPRGFAAACILAAVLALAVAAWAVNPVEEAEQQATTAARSVGLIEGRCPNGWEHNFIADHSVVETCWRGDWAVTLYPNGLKKANYGLDTTAGENAREVACSQIPNWPSSWCIE